MINHNFLPYDICLLLPESNPYKNSLFTNTWVQDDTTKEYFIVPYLNFMSIRDAWTIMDALQYIEDTYKYYICVKATFKYYTVNTSQSGQYITRTEAYIAGIKYVLELENIKFI